MSGHRAAQRIWFGQGAGAALARGALGVPALGFGAGVAVRNALYDSGVLAVHGAALPTISVGNLTVGGTGKTPVAAWIAAELARRGAHPAVVLRGYGGDEPVVHARLNPGVPVVANPDRVAGVRRARELGADVVVLDDAFQHRRIAREVDLVVVAAERGLDGARMLPAGPYRESVRALRRATGVVVTRKTADPSRASAVLEAAVRAGCPYGAVVALRADGIVPVGGGDALGITVLAGHRVLLATGVGEPDLLAAQLGAVGAQVDLQAFPDHHAFSDAELTRLGARSANADYALCTLKDAVKIGARWPGPRPLWYVSQRLIVERGEEWLGGMLNGLLATIASKPQTAG